MWKKGHSLRRAAKHFNKLQLQYEISLSFNCIPNTFNPQTGSANCLGWCVWNKESNLCHYFHISAIMNHKICLFPMQTLKNQITLMKAMTSCHWHCHWQPTWMQEGKRMNPFFLLLFLSLKSMKYFITNTILSTLSHATSTSFKYSFYTILKTFFSHYT